MGKKVLLTGAAGLIGAYAISPLRQAGFDVLAVSRRPHHAENARWLAADLLDLGGLERIFSENRPEYLLHLAWDTRPGRYLEDNANFAWVSATLEMLRHFHHYGGRRAVLVGTCLEYEPAERPLKETDALAPTSTYAACKNHLNRLAARFCRKNGISCGWARLFNVFGAGEKAGRLTPTILEALRNGEALTIHGGPLIRDYMYAGDIAAALVAFLHSQVEGEVNICTGKGVSIRDYCLRFAGKMHQEHLLTFEDRPGNQPPSIIGDNRRLREEVGFFPAYDLELGIEAVRADTRAIAKQDSQE